MLTMLEYIRKLYNYTMEYLGKEIGVSKQAISQYETGKLELNEDKINKLSKVFINIPKEYFKIRDVTEIDKLLIQNIKLLNENPDVILPDISQRYVRALRDENDVYRYIEENRSKIKALKTLKRYEDFIFKSEEKSAYNRIFEMDRVSEIFDKFITIFESGKKERDIIIRILYALIKVYNVEIDNSEWGDVGVIAGKREDDNDEFILSLIDLIKKEEERRESEVQKFKERLRKFREQYGEIPDLIE